MVRLESSEKIADLASKLLRRADALDVLPTPLDQLCKVADVTNISALPEETFLDTLTEGAKAAFRTAWQKLRGIADMRTRATYVPRDSSTRRERFARGHELGHQVIPWHDVDPAYFDDAETLGPAAKGRFEQEATHPSGEPTPSIIDTRCWISLAKRRRDPMVFVIVAPKSWRAFLVFPKPIRL